MNLYNQLEHVFREIIVSFTYFSYFWQLIFLLFRGENKIIYIAITIITAGLGILHLIFYFAEVTAMKRLCEKSM